MDEILKQFVRKFEEEGIRREFKGTPIVTIPNLTFGKNVDENGEETYYMINSSNRIVYKFKNEEQARTIAEFITKGI